jgi:hypothetical protein
MSGNTSQEGKNTSVELYAPVFRDGYIERGVMEEFAGLTRFEGGRLDLLPIIEVTEESDLDNLNSYAQAGSPVLVDAPRYLTETEEPNDLTEDVDDLLSSAGGSVEFLKENSNQIEVPVASGSLDSPSDYTGLNEYYDSLSDTYDRVALRVFIPSAELEDWQLEDLRSLEDEIDSEDIVLLDYFQSGNLGPPGTGRENLITASSIFEDHLRIILDAFNVFKGVNYNFGPAIANEAGVEGFGDFAVNQRYPPAEDIPMGLHDTRTIRHYDFDDREIAEFEGEGFNGANSAYEDLSSWDKWNPDHCEFCEEAAAENSEGFGFWKRVRVGHYIDSVLEEEA